MGECVVLCVSFALLWLFNGILDELHVRVDNMIHYLVLHNKVCRLQFAATGIFFLVSDLLKLKAMVLDGSEP